MPWRLGRRPLIRPTGQSWGGLGGKQALRARFPAQLSSRATLAFAQFRIDLNGQQLPFFGTPDDEISTVLDVAAWVEQRMAGWDCHQSQHNPQGMWSGVSDEARRAFASREYLQLIAHRLPISPQHEIDLWTGIELIAPSDDGASPEMAAVAGAINDDSEQDAVDPASAAAGDRCWPPCAAAAPIC